MEWPRAGEGSSGGDYTKRAEAVAAISEWISTHTPEYGNSFRQKQDHGTMVSLGGHELQVCNAAEDSRLGSYQDLAISLKDVPAPALVFTRMELLEGSAGIITRLENKVSGLPDFEAQLRQTITEKQAVLAGVESQAGKPFKYEDKLIAARARCAELEEKLQASIDPPKPPPAAEVSGPEADPGLARLRRLQAASFPAAPKNTHPQHSHPTPQGRAGAAPGHSREGGFECLPRRAPVVCPVGGELGTGSLMR
ncbi:hypothetical protein AB0O52_18680 [Arthrobacter sp. NPDC080073]|uniref:hypothetical protein n=1 Tax=Arthrobacter sp. NPDC080073 TaxID=3155919 RepID=UPI0034323D3A